MRRVDLFQATMQGWGLVAAKAQDCSANADALTDAVSLIVSVPLASR